MRITIAFIAILMFAATGCCGHRNNTIYVRSARYGNGEKWVDVTPQCRRLVNGDTIIFPRDLHTTFDVDPDPGFMKYVEMVVAVGGREMKVTVADNLQLTPLRITAGHSHATRTGD